MIAAIAAASLVAGRRPIEANLAPFAIVRVNGDPQFINAECETYFSLPESVSDGLYDAQYLFRLPAGERVRLELAFTTPIRASRIMFLGSSDQQPARVRIVCTHPDGREQVLKTASWSTRDGIPPIEEIAGPPEFVSLAIESTDGGELILNNVGCYVVMERWRAWARFLFLNLALPAAVGAMLLLTVLGSGSILSSPEDSLAWRFTVGLGAVFLASLVWIVLPRGIAADVSAGVASTLAAALELRRLGRDRQARDDLGVALKVGLLLLSTVAVDSALLGNRRIIPVDHLYGYFGAKNLAIGRLPPVDVSYRPWLVHVVATPFVAWSGRYGYWAYLGIVAFLNASVVWAARAWLDRWLGTAASRARLLFCLMPVLALFHFPGQRPLAAMLGLVALAAWMRPEPKLVRGGWAAALALLAHPSVLFVLPSAAVYFLHRDGLGRGVARAAAAMTIPVLAYGAWTGFARLAYPGEGNPILFYPLMTSLDQRFPGMGAAEAVASLPAEHWKQLAWNRVVQLRYYLWADNPWQPVVDVFRPVSLPSAFGFVGALSLLRPSAWRRDFAFALVAAIAPLAVQLLYLGQPDAQLQIAALPFFALALLATSSLFTAPGFLRRLAIGEWFLRQIYPVVVGTFYPADRFCLFADDQTSYLILSFVLPLAWLWIWIDYVASFSKNEQGDSRGEERAKHTLHSSPIR